jgi:phenylalanyl-tRNA synthetase beta chain
VRRGNDGETLRTLDGEERTLNPEILVIADDRGAVALAGVMGGLESEVVEGKTKHILLEAANFSGPSIRRTATALKMRSEASARFEKGLPAEFVAIASKRATKLLVEVCGGRALAGSIDVYPGKQKERRVEVAKDRIARVLGIDPPASQVRGVLTSLGFTARWVPPDRYAVRVPYWRPDVRIDDDVAEEVGRIVGYDAIPAELIAGSVPPPIVQPLRELRERACAALAAAGMQEVITYSLTTTELLARVTPKEDLAIYPPVRVANPISSEHEVLRTTLRASILQSIASNLRYEKGEMAIFEAARVYHRADTRRTPEGTDAPAGAGALPEEREHICGAVTGLRHTRWGEPGDQSLDFFDTKAYVDDLLRTLNAQAEYVPATEFAFAPGRTAEIRVEGQRVGVVGQIHPEVAAEFEIEQDVFVFDLVLDDLLPHAGTPRKMTAVPRFPAVEQDLALIVDEPTPAGVLLGAIASSSLVRDARIFDEYRGEQVPAGKKSLAFRISYQSLERTLTDDDVAKAQRKLIERLRREFGAEPRGR